MRASMNLPFSFMRWSDGRTIIVVWGSFFFFIMAAGPHAAAVFLAAGSAIIFFMEGRSDLIEPNCSLLVITYIRSLGTIDFILLTVSWIRDRLPMSLSVCLGVFALLFGQNLSPLPPAIMTA